MTPSTHFIFEVTEKEAETRTLSGMTSAEALKKSPQITLLSKTIKIEVKDALTNSQGTDFFTENSTTDFISTVTS